MAILAVFPGNQGRDRDAASIWRYGGLSRVYSQNSWTGAPVGEEGRLNGGTVVARGNHVLARIAEHFGLDYGMVICALGRWGRGDVAVQP
jgi:hypothetical protein